ncbi:MAG: hypothetical protein HC866_19460 [Leptolyngbyaceae cyanobacterium RU_5_1]|nr:hypothetical protein [Leptolyngbyaceae cyanobacterium RU_5_1]
MVTTGYSDRVLVVEVTGLRQQGVAPVSNCTFKVPYRSLSRTLQFISRQHGKVIRIAVLSGSLPASELFQLSSSLQFARAPQTLPSSKVESKQVLTSDGAVDKSEPIQPSPEALPPTIEVGDSAPAQSSGGSDSLGSESVDSQRVASKTEAPSSPSNNEPNASDSSDTPSLMTRLVEKLRQNIQGSS